VTVIRRFASGLRLNVHAHTLLPDGVFYEDASGALRFHVLVPPSDDDIADLVATVRKRILLLLERRGHGALSADDASCDDDPVQAAEPALAPLLGASVAVGAEDRPGLERLCCYLLRPAVPEQRLQLLDDGRVLLELKHEWNDGTSHLVLDPLDLLARLVTFMPKPRTNLILYHGLFAANAKWRPRVVAYRGPREEADGRSVATATPPGPCSRGEPESQSSRTESASNYSWSDLMQRSFGVDVLDCPKCHHPMQLIAVILAGAAAQSILEHLGLPTELPEPRPARAPPDHDWN
jgi:hypothetical protein